MPTLISLITYNSTFPPIVQLLILIVAGLWQSEYITSPHGIVLSYVLWASESKRFVSQREDHKPGKTGKNCARPLPHTVPFLLGAKKKSFISPSS